MGGGGAAARAPELDMIDRKFTSWPIGFVSAQEGLWEEAELLRARELDMTASEPSGAPARLPRVDVADIEAVVSTWTGIDVQRLGQDEKSRLLQLASVLEVGFC